MPIYEYQAKDPAKGCAHCIAPFEEIQGMSDAPLKACPECGGAVRKIISRCRAAIMEMSEEQRQVEDSIGGHERAGRWSHAAELADKHSEKTNDSALKNRAMDNYKKAGYDV